MNLIMGYLWLDAIQFFMEPEDLESMGPLRKRLGIPKEALLCYVQLGAGKINDINSEISHGSKCIIPASKSIRNRG